MKSVLRLLFLLPVLLPAPLDHANTSVNLPRGPGLILWAWERPELLGVIDPRKVSVAYLDQTLYVRDRVTAVPRLQPLRVPAGTNLISVVRIEMPVQSEPPAEKTKDMLVAALLRSAHRAGISALQVDFDAARSQRPFYREVLTRLRRQMPAQMPLSITALASWCAKDDWIAELPVDEAVPMFFRMGQERNLFSASSVIREPHCLGSLGLATDEPWPLDHVGKRIYVFNSKTWTADALASISARLTQ